MAMLTVIGAGPGAAGLLTGEAREAIRNSGRVYAAARLAGCCRALNSGIRAGGLEEIFTALEDEVSDAAVLVSGDTGFFSLARTLRLRLGERYAYKLLPGISSLQMLCARLGQSWEDVQVVSVHGVQRPVAGPAAYCPRVFYLTGGGGSASRVLRELAAAGLGELCAHLGENLSGADERIRTGTVAELAGEDIAPLSVLLVENPHPADRFRRLRDADFQRGEAPMTKESIRALILSRLEVAPGDIVYDIGAGTGAVSAELARRAWEGTIYAVEYRPQALELLERNRRQLGTYNVAVTEGTAPEALVGLPAPDKVFVGGSEGHMEAIVDALLDKGGGFTVCMTAITLETAHTAVRLLESRGFADVEMVLAQISHACRVGDSHMLRGENPVALISGRWVG